MIYTQSYAYIQINKLKHTKYVHTYWLYEYVSWVCVYLVNLYVYILTGILASTSHEPSLAGNKSHHQNSQDICK